MMGKEKGGAKDGEGKRRHRGLTDLTSSSSMHPSISVLFRRTRRDAPLNLYES